MFAVIGRRRPRPALRPIHPLCDASPNGPTPTPVQEMPAMKIHSYVMFPGTAREAFAFYAQVLRGSVTASMTYGESPDGETPAAYRDWIMHTCLEVGDQLLMGSDHAPFCPGSPYDGIKGSSLSLQIDDPDEARRVFDVLSKDAKEIMMPLAPTFWAQQFGMCTDRFGVPWMINCPPAAEGEG
jgi:PhnB protein